MRISRFCDENVHWKPGNRNFFYWPILRVSLSSFKWAIQNQNLTGKKKVIGRSTPSTPSTPIQNSKFQSPQNQILRTPIAWTYPRVGQIRSQIKKLIFLKKWVLGWPVSNGRSHRRTLTYKRRRFCVIAFSKNTLMFFANHFSFPKNGFLCLEKM